MGVALVSTEVAARGGTVNFAAEKDQFWGFHVLEDGEVLNASNSTNVTVHEVPTRSLLQIRVRMQSFTNYKLQYFQAVCAYP